MFQGKVGKSLLFAVGALSSALLAAEPVKRAGNVCWNGEVTGSVATSKDNRAWTYKINWVFIPGGETKDATSGECVGIASMVDGKPELLPNFCSHFHKDDATHLSRGVNDDQGKQKRTYYGGTGSLEGIMGGSVGMPMIQLKAPKGKFSGCRTFQSEYTVDG